MDIDQMLESLGAGAVVSAKLKPQTQEQHNAVNDVFDRIVDEELAPRLTISHVREGGRSAVRVMGTRVGVTTVKALVAVADEFGLEFGIYAMTELSSTPLGGESTIGSLAILIAPASEYEPAADAALVADAPEKVLH